MSLFSSANTCLSTNNKNKKNIEVSTGPRRAMSLQETNGKLLKKGNVKTSRALSVDEIPDGVGDMEEEQQMENMSM